MEEPYDMIQKNIVILGAGFGGLAAAKTLGRAMARNEQLRHRYAVLLIDRNDKHLYTPGLYEVATALREDAAPLILKKTASIAIEDVLERLPVRFIQDEVTGIDMETMRVILRDSGLLHAAYLIIALGAVTSDFNILGVRKYGYMLKTFEDALRLRGAVEQLLREKTDAHILIAGGGATGVELGGELATLAQTIRRRFRATINPSFTIVDASSRLIPGPPDRFARIARRRLEKLGVAIRLNARITAVEEHAAVIVGADGKQERIPFDLFIWSGGIRPAPILEGIVVPKDPRGRCLVDPDLTIHGFDNVFAIGDLTCFSDPVTGKPLPATAYIAIEEGTVAAHNVLARIEGRGLRHFHPPRRPPMITPVGGKWAVAYLGGLTFSGLTAFLVRLAVDLRYFVKVLPPLRALRFFLHSTLIYFRND